jgi:hypothetical protein
MGYDAHVCCNCFEQGKIKAAPPFPVTRNERGYFHVATPECEEDNVSKPCLEQERAIFDWEENACEHQWIHLKLTR